MKCKIIFERDPKTLKVTDKIKAVKAPNGQKSILFDDIRSQVVDDKLSLETYYKTYTDEFKDKVKGVGKDKNDEVIFEEVKDIILPSRMLASVGYKNWDLININGWLNHLRDFIKSDDEKTKSYASNLHLPNIKRMMDELATDSTNRMNRVVNDVTKILSKHTDKDTIQSITDLIKTEDLDNIELVKQLIIPIVDKSVFYPNNSGNVSNEISNMIDELSNILDVIDDIYMVKDDELSNLNSEVRKLSKLVDPIRDKYDTYIIPDLLEINLTSDERDIVNNELTAIKKWRNRANELKDLNKSKFNDTVNKLKDKLSNYTDSETVEGIIQYIVRSDYELQSEDNIELAKQLIKGIIENPGLYSSSDIKPGVDHVYEQNKELAKIGSKQEYSDYLDTIFPDSKVKDILFHGTNNIFDKFDISFEGSNEKGGRGKGFNFTKDLEDTDLYGDIKMSVLINVDKRVIKDSEARQTPLSYIDDVDEIVVFDSNQIHILGSTKDIAQFTHYIKTRKASTSSGTQSNNIRSKYFADNDTQSHRDILQKIVDNKEAFSPLAKKLLTINSKNVPITLKPVDVLYSFTDNFGNKQEAAAMYQNGRIEMSEFGNYKGGKYGFESTVIHEILHAFTWNELRLNTKNAQELKAIYQEALKYKDSFSDQYSISNIDEFLVAIFTNANFIKDIQKIPSIYPEKHQSLWEDVLEFFKAWFQFNNKEASLLDDAFYVANKILIDYSNDPDQVRHKEQSVRESNEVMADEYVWTDDEGNPLAEAGKPGINYMLKSVDILQSDKAKQVFEKGKKVGWNLDKILSELQIPKPQKDLILNTGLINREDIILELSSNYSFVVDINIGLDRQNKYDIDRGVFKVNNITFSGGWDAGKQVFYKKDKVLQRISKEEYEQAKNLLANISSQYYANLTVPGGTNYTENEITTPLITPSIKGHAQFSTDNGIGWHRADDQVVNVDFFIKQMQDSGDLKIEC